MRTPVSLVFFFLVGCGGGKSPGEQDTVGQDTELRADDVDRDGFSASEDCDDTDAAINPGADELCDGIDNDCDDLIDDMDDDLASATWYTDSDGDGYGDESAPITSCTQPEGTIATGGDCNDADAAYHPGADEADCTDPADYNCDGSTGADDLDGDGVVACEDCDDGDGAVTAGETWYTDGDGDGYGSSDGATVACAQPAGTAATAGDCDDADAAYNPGAEEWDCADPNDYNCDGEVDYADADGDGTAACFDCDDADGAVWPGAAEVCDSVDNDCDALIDDDDDAVEGRPTWYADGDRDGYGFAESATESCTAPEGTVANGDDCDDMDILINPDAIELCDAVDNDCDGLVDDDDDDAAEADTWYGDGDGDGYGDASDAVFACDKPSGYVETDTDCNDSNNAVHPGASEICDSVDNDCDGLTDDADSDVSGAYTWYADEDEDHYGDPDSGVLACSKPSGYTSDDTDCDDSQKEVNPDKDEKCDALDNDCSGYIDDGDVCDCDVDWYGDHAYQFCNSYASWEKASSSCEDDGYTLVTIDDAGEHSFVYGEAATYGSYYSWWIGLNDRDSEGTYVWEDGSAVSYTSWASGEPDGGRYSDCAMMYLYYGDDWYDYYCSSYLFYTCEST